MNDPLVVALLVAGGVVTLISLLGLLIAVVRKDGYQAISVVNVAAPIAQLPPSPLYVKKRRLLSLAAILKGLILTFAVGAILLVALGVLCVVAAIAEVDAVQQNLTAAQLELAIDNEFDTIVFSDQGLFAFIAVLGLSAAAGSYSASRRAACFRLMHAIAGVTSGLLLLSAVPNWVDPQMARHYADLPTPDWFHVAVISAIAVGTVVGAVMGPRD